MADGKSWFKVWTSILSDPDFGDLHNQTIGVWLRLGALVALHGTNGQLSISKDQFLKQTHLMRVTDEAELLRICAELGYVNVTINFEKDSRYTCNVTFHNWMKYQANSESYERVKRYREKKASVTRETQMKQSCNADKEEKRREEKRREEKRREKKRKEPPISPRGFDSFYLAYPRKTGKEAALKAWLKISPENGLLEKIMSALEAQKKSDAWLKDNGEFIPYPATWLNGKRWEDETQGSKKIDYRKLLEGE